MKRRSLNTITWAISLGLSIYFNITVGQAQVWTSLQGPTKARNVNDICASGDGQTLYGVDQSVLFKSTNGGISWFSTQTEIASPLVVICASDEPDVVSVGLNGVIKFSGSGGYAWGMGYSGTFVPLRIAASPITGQTSYMFLGRQAVVGSNSILYSADGGHAWTLLTSSPIGSNINDIAPYPVAGSRSQHVWAVGSDPSAGEGQSSATHGVWQSTNLGTDWTQKLDNHNCTAVAIINNSPIPFIFAGTSSGQVYRSDEGSNWSLYSSYGTASSATIVRAIRVDANNWIYVASDKGIHRSTDAGNSWTEMTTSFPSGEKNILSFIITGYSKNIMFATTTDTIFKSTDGGSTWNNPVNGFGHYPISSINSYQGSLWTVSDVFTSLVGKFDGTSWTNTSVAQTFIGKGILHHPNGTVFVCGQLGSSSKAALYSSTNGQTYGSVLVGINTSSIYNGIVYDPAATNYIYLFGLDGSNGLFINGNSGGGNWTGLNIGNYGKQANVVAIDGSTKGTYDHSQLIEVGFNDVGIQRTSNGGGQWYSSLSSCTILGMTFNPSLPNMVYASGQQGVWENQNSGWGSWTQFRSDPVKKIIMNPGQPSSGSCVVALLSDGTKIYYSNNGGYTWLDGTGSLPTPIKDITGEVVSIPYVYAATTYGCYKITPPVDQVTLTSPNDNSTTPTLAPTLTWNATSGANGYHIQIYDNHNPQQIVVDDPNVSTTSYVPYNLDVAIYHWKVAANNVAGEAPFSSTRTFTTQATGTISLSGGLYVGGDNQLHPSLSWTSSGQGSVFTLYKYSCTYGGGDCGVWPYPLITTVPSTCTSYVDSSVIVAHRGQTPTTTYYYQIRSAGISNKVTYNSANIQQISIPLVGVELPLVTQLKGNYPNPFNPMTTIEYGLAGDTHVSLKIYDVLGRVVMTVLDDEETAGYKSVVVDASHLSSGLYFYRLTAGGYVAMKKMMLLK